MQPFDEIRKHCEKCRILNRTVIDEFLIHYAADKMNLVPEMEAAIRKYKKASSEIRASYLNYLRSEYIAHRIFKKNGLIHKILKHSALQHLTQEEMEFLRLKSENPWRFSFAEITSNPDDSFFMMEDVMTAEEYLLYSPGMEATLKEHKPWLWFNLIEFNGYCWQTFGLIIPFVSFSEDDIFFFASEVNPKIENEEMLMEVVERNPIPFFMLTSASNSPVIASRGHVTVICQSTDKIPGLPVENLEVSFDISKKENVYQLSPKKLETIPHFAQAYYNEGTGELLRTSMTTQGFRMLTDVFRKKGIHLEAEADTMVSPAMLLATEKILNRKIELNPYERYFSPNEEESEDLTGFNTFLGLALPFYNEGKEIDINKLAAKAGIDPSVAADLWKQVKKKTDEMKNKTW
jgi:hypothetical protein